MMIILQAIVALLNNLGIIHLRMASHAAEMVIEDIDHVRDPVRQKDGTKLHHDLQVMVLHQEIIVREMSPDILDRTRGDLAGDEVVAKINSIAS